MARIARILASFSLVLAVSSAAWGAGPFPYHLPQGPGVDSNAITVVGQPKTHHIVRYENLYQIAEKYDQGFWELAKFHRKID